MISRAHNFQTFQLEYIGKTRFYEETHSNTSADAPFGCNLDIFLATRPRFVLLASNQGPQSVLRAFSSSFFYRSSSGPLPYIVSLTLRTTVPTVHIITGENIFGQQLFNVGLSEGRLVVTIHDATYSKLIPYTINDGGWYTLSLEKTEKVLRSTFSSCLFAATRQPFRTCSLL